MSTPCNERFLCVTEKPIEGDCRVPNNNHLRKCSFKHTWSDPTLEHNRELLNLKPAVTSKLSKQTCGFCIHVIQSLLLFSLLPLVTTTPFGVSRQALDVVSESAKGAHETTLFNGDEGNGEYCKGYFNDKLKFRWGFYCRHYCCGTARQKFCCRNKVYRFDGAEEGELIVDISDWQSTFWVIIGCALGSILLITLAILLSCCFCCKQPSGGPVRGQEGTSSTLNTWFRPHSYYRAVRSGRVHISLEESETDSSSEEIDDAQYIVLDTSSPTAAAVL